MDEVGSLRRRDLLAGVGALALGAAMNGGSAVAAPSAETNKVYSPGTLPRDLPQSAFKQMRAKIALRPPFDLDDRLGRSLARLKVLENLEGKTSYFACMTRHLLCPPGKPPVPYINELDLFALFITRPDGFNGPDSDTSALIQNSMFTRIPVDPITLQPIQEFKNPVTGRTVELPHTLFATTTPMALGKDGPGEVLLQPGRPHYRLGADIRFIMLDIRAGDGAYQPRVDTVTWKVRYDDLMNPRRPLINADYAYTALMRASVFPWTAAAPDDPMQILSIRFGLKVNSAADVPEPVASIVRDRYPERFA